MSILNGIIKERIFKKVDGGFKKVSRDTVASTVFKDETSNQTLDSWMNEKVDVENVQDDINEVLSSTQNSVPVGAKAIQEYDKSLLKYNAETDTYQGYKDGGWYDVAGGVNDGDFYLIKDGILNETLCKGFVARKIDYSSSHASPYTLEYPTIKQTQSTYDFKFGNSGVNTTRTASVFTGDLIDLTNVKSITVQYKAAGCFSNFVVVATKCLDDGFAEANSSIAYAQHIGLKETITLSVGLLKGYYYLAFGLRSGAGVGDASIYNIKFNKA